jgi:predicted acetyltransferase
MVFNAILLQRESLVNFGGHIAYGIRPPERKKDMRH